LAVTVGCLIRDRHKIYPIPFHYCLTREKAKEYKIGVGDDAYMIGRFIGHDGKVHNEPTARFGNVSADVRPMRNTRTDQDEESYGVEMHSRPGCSGSPMLVYSSAFNQFYNRIRPPEKLWFEFLLGVNWGQVVEKISIRDNSKEKELQSHAPILSGMNGVVPSWHLLDLMEQRDVQDAIAKIETRQLKFMEEQRAVSLTGSRRPERTG
jgi:hypothetical protein